MKITRSVITGVVVIVVISVAAYSLSMRQRFKSREQLTQKVVEMGPSADTMESLRSTIALYEKRLDEYVSDVAKTGSYWKILAIRLQDQGLNGEALAALQNALYYSPTDPTLHYLTGVCAGIMAKSVYTLSGNDQTEKSRYYEIAEEAYLRSIELDRRYFRPLYGIGVLYVFELNRPADALPYLERCLEISRSDIDTLFVQARAYYMLGNYQNSVDTYDRIITLTRDNQKRIEAQENRQTVIGIMHG